MSSGRRSRGRRWSVRRRHSVAAIHDASVKLGRLAALAEAEPQLEPIATWNAAWNEHMVGINELLGCEVAGRLHRSVELGAGPPHA